MQQSPWHHQTIERVGLTLPDPTVHVFVSGVAVGVVIVLGILLLRRSARPGRPAGGRAAVASGWADVFRLVAFVVRGMLLLTLGLLLLGRLLLWPSGRRW